jgi:hypothetical protein
MGFGVSVPGALNITVTGTLALSSQDVCWPGQVVCPTTSYTYRYVVLSSKVRTSFVTVRWSTCSLV